ncbi:hypothetical protein D9741_21995 [Escherichia sp. E14V7]|nr:hypothetical protein D9740_12735 [Escherichia sp. E14V5]RZN00134.1 hypothetical protein D9741_21995 [Escherichia sp. E14V7]RZN24821.1 hypothetical protein D9739_18645 [Escherichia sp. E14V10]
MPIVGCGVNALSDLDSRRPDKTQSVASGMLCRLSDAAQTPYPTWIPVGRTRRKASLPAWCADCRMRRKRLIRPGSP